MSVEPIRADLCHGTTLGGIQYRCAAAVTPNAKERACTGEGTVSGIDYACRCDCHVLPTIDPTAPGCPIPSVDPTPYLPADPYDRFRRQIAANGEDMCGAEAPADLRVRVRNLSQDALALTTCHLPTHTGNVHIGQLIQDRTDLWARTEYQWIDE